MQPAVHDAQADAGRQVPHSMAAEQALLGALLEFPQQAWSACSSIVTAGDFYVSGHRAIFAAVAQLMTAGEPVDLFTVEECLERAGAADDAGGRDYLNRLAQAVPSAANVAQYAASVRDHAARRELMAAGDRMQQAAMRASTATEALQTAQDLIASVRARVRLPDGDHGARSFDAADLLAMPMAEPNYIVRPFIPEGVMLWCGRPKMGKTTALRQLARAVNSGGTFLGEQCEPAEVWFLSLEEGERLFRQKLAKMGAQPEDLAGIRVEFEWPQAGEGVQALRERLRARPRDAKPVLIVIDSLQRFRLPQSARGHAFTEDYNAAKQLSELCKEFHGLSVVLLHHTTKAAPDDPVAAISGTYGLTAAVDSYAIMLKQGGQFRLHIGGRLWDRDCSDYELRRAGGSWELVGEFEPATTAQGFAPKQEQALAALKSGAKSNRALAEVTGQSASAVSHMMGKLADRGLVVRLANGWGLA